MVFGFGFFFSSLIVGIFKEWYNVIKGKGLGLIFYLFCWDLFSIKIDDGLRRLIGYEDDIYDLILMRDGCYLISGFGDGIIGLWDFYSEKVEL